MTVEQLARAMTRRERVAHLRDHGWYRLGPRHTQNWRPPVESWRAYTVAAAIRAQLEDEATP